MGRTARENKALRNAASQFSFSTEDEASWYSLVRRHYETLGSKFDELFSDVDDFSRREGSLLHAALSPHHVRTVLDCTCGTGIQAVSLAKLGYEVTGVDFAIKMLSAARDKAHREGVRVRFHEANLLSLRSSVQGLYHAVLSCGNSLPHLFDTGAMLAALGQMKEMLVPKGLIGVEIRNYPKLLRDVITIDSKTAQGRPPEGGRFHLRRLEISGDRQLLVYDVREFSASRLWVTSVLVRANEGKVEHLRSTVGYTLISPHQVERLMERAGFRTLEWRDGSLGCEFSPKQSDWCLLVAEKREGVHAH